MQPWRAYYLLAYLLSAELWRTASIALLIAFINSL